MRSKLLAAAVVALSAAAAPAAEGLTKGTVEVKSISALAFGPNGLLFIGDSQAASVIAVDTGDYKPAGPSLAPAALPALDKALATSMGIDPGAVTVADVKVNPASGNVYIAARNAKGGGASLFRLTRTATDAKIEPFALKDVPSAKVSLPNPSQKSAAEVITGMAFIDGKVIVAGLSSEEFASTLRAVPYPFQAADKGAGIEIFHGAHGKLETASPVRTFTTYKIGGADYLLAAYTCTPLVKIPVSDLKAGAKVKGTTIAELGNRNRPLDMIVYTKGGADYLLMANSARGVMKIPTAGMDKAEAITARPKTEKAGVTYETIAALQGVEQLDKLDANNALVLIKSAAGLELKPVPLP